MRLGIILIILCVFTGSLSGQKTGKKITLTGTVTDAKSVPVAGASLFIDNKNTKQSTDSKGQFKIRAGRDALKIQAFSASHGSGEAFIDSSGIVNIKLSGSNDLTATKKETEAIETVSVGYGTVEKNKNTGSVKETTIKKNKYAGYNNIYDVIRREFPTVRINGTSIILSGISTFAGSNEALLVVDGIEVNQISDIYPGDVESITILDGANAAIYGVKGANGVVLIQTFRGYDKK